MKLSQLIAVVTFGTAELLAADRRLIISIPDRKMVLLEDGKVKRVYDIAVGATATPTPTGQFAIKNRIENPNWLGPKGIVPPGPSNPLGTRWMGLGYRGYGIHGTNAPKSIGKAASHGCIRMRIRDVEELFNLVEAGDPVEILRDLPIEVAQFFTAASAAENAFLGGGE